MTSAEATDAAARPEPARPLRVLHAIPSFLGGGAERQLAYLAEQLPRFGVEVDIAYMLEGPNSDRIRASRAVLHPLGARRATDVRLLFHLLRIIRDRRPDVVQTWLPRMDIYGGIAASLVGLPWIYSERSVWIPPTDTVSRLRWKIVATADAVIANSTAGSHYWREAGMDVHVIPNSVPTREIDAAPPAARSEFGVAEDAELVLYAGRFDVLKNIPLLETTLFRLLRERPRAVAICCGVGPLLAAFQRSVAAAGLETRILTPGYRSDVWSLMKAVDVLIAPSEHEGRPNVVVEAMACGCPLVLSDIPEHRECVPEDAAMFFPLASPEAGARVLGETFDDRIAARERAARARVATEQFGAVEMAQRYARAYRSIAFRSAPG